MMHLSPEHRTWLLVAWFLYGVFLFPHNPVDLIIEPKIAGNKQPSGPVQVTVLGEVGRPGNYPCELHTTVMQAIEAAGGVTTRADLSRLNLAARLIPSSVLRVPSREYGFEPVISLNRSAARELVEIPGIGPKLAARIVKSRDEAGLFKNEEDLLRVSGIGEKKLRLIMKHAVLN